MNKFVWHNFDINISFLMLFCVIVNRVSNEKCVFPLTVTHKKSNAKTQFMLIKKKIWYEMQRNGKKKIPNKKNEIPCSKFDQHHTVFIMSHKICIRQQQSLKINFTHIEWNKNQLLHNKLFEQKYGQTIEREQKINLNICTIYTYSIISALCFSFYWQIEWHFRENLFKFDLQYYMCLTVCWLLG